MDGGSSVRFGHSVAAGSVHLGAGGDGGGHQVMPAGAGMIPAGMGSFLLGAGGMLAPGGGMVQPGGYLAPAGYGTVPNALHAAWNGAGGQQQQPPAGAGTGVLRLPPLRGPWTEEEDETLKAMVQVYGERKWAAIARHLHGRIGKQCRERWTNHLRPEIDKAKNTWTEQDDMELIRAHKIHGNRWSMIARTMEGRSENSVKNHWNATKRSLKAKRRLKKKKNAEAPPGQQWSVLEEYIRSLRPDDLAAAPPAPPSDDSPPSSYNVGYDGEVVSPPTAPGGGFNPAAMGLYLSAAGNSSSAAASAVNLAAWNPNVAPQPYLGLDLNAYYYGAPLQQAPPQMMMTMMGQDQQAAASYAADNLITYPFVDHLAWHSPVPNADAYAASNANAAAGQHYYHSDAGAGPSAAANPEDDVDVVQMASREFQLNPSEEEVTLNLAGFV